MSKQIQTINKPDICHLLIVPKERSLIWQKLKGKWSNRSGLAINLKKIRRQWDRKILDV